MDDEISALLSELQVGADDPAMYEVEMVEGIRALVALQQQQIQLLQVIAQRLGPKRIVRDARGEIAGTEPAQ